MNTNSLILALSLMKSWYPKLTITSIMFEDGSGNTFCIDGINDEGSGEKYFLRLHPTSKSLVTLKKI